MDGAYTDAGMGCAGTGGEKVQETNGFAYLTLTAGQIVTVVTSSETGSTADVDAFWGEVTLTQFAGYLISRNEDSEIAFQAHLSAAQTNIGAEALLAFDTEILNLGGAFDASTSEFTVTHDGAYFFIFEMYSQTNEGDLEPQIWVNGAFRGVGTAYATTGGVGYQEMVGFAVLELSVGDTVSVKTGDLTSTAGDFVAYDGGGYLSHFGGHFLGAELSVGFSAYKSTTVSNVGAEALVEFDTAYTNIGDAYDASTSKFTAPSAGLYFFICSVYSASNNANLGMKMLKNGENVGIGGVATTSGDQEEETTGVYVMELEAGDEIAIYTDSSTGAGADIEGVYTQFAGYKIEHTAFPPTPAPTMTAMPTLTAAPTVSEIAFQAYLSADVANIGPNEIIEFDTVSLDEGGAWDVVKGEYVAPYDGLYFFMCVCRRENLPARSSSL